MKFQDDLTKLVYIVNAENIGKVTGVYLNRVYKDGTSASHFPYIVLVSTPNAPRGLFEKIELEPQETCIYKRIKLDYTYGINRIYTKAEIDKAKRSPSFGREYDLQYLGLIGNTFHTGDIERATELSKKYKTVNVFACYLRVSKLRRFEYSILLHIWTSEAIVGYEKILERWFGLRSSSSGRHLSLAMSDFTK